MTVTRILKTRPPALYRWVRKRRLFPYAAALCCLFLILPVGVFGGARLAGSFSGGAALAALPGTDPVSAPLVVRGLSEDAVIEALAVPALRRRDGAAQVWQYRTDSCVLDVFFGAKDTVVRTAFRPRRTAVFAKPALDTGISVDETACLRALKRQG